MKAHKHFFTHPVERHPEAIPKTDKMGHKSSKIASVISPDDHKCLHITEIERRLAEKVWLALKPLIENGFVLEAGLQKAHILDVTFGQLSSPRMQNIVLNLINVNYLAESGLMLDYLCVANAVEKDWRLSFAVCRQTPTGESPPAYDAKVGKS